MATGPFLFVAPTLSHPWGAHAIDVCYAEYQRTWSRATTKYLTQCTR